MNKEYIERKFGHVLVKLDKNTFIEDYTCEKCNAIIWASGSTGFYRNKVIQGWRRNISCDEMIIKNIIE